MSGPLAVTTLDWVKALLPVVTFVLGYLLSLETRRRETKRQLSNIRGILLKELKEDYRALVQVWPPADDPDAAIAHPELVAQLCARLSSAVYDEFLGRLDGLKRSELEAAYDAYSQVTELARRSTEYLEARDRDSGADPGLLAQRGVVIAVLSDSARQKVAAAMRELPGGQAAVLEVESERGSGYATVHELSDALVQLDEAAGSDRNRAR
jgi:hypothetical protein